MNGQVVSQKKEARLLGLYITYNMSQSYFVEDMKNNLLSLLSQRFPVLAMMSERACKKNRKQLAYGLIYSKLIFAIQFWSTCSEKQKKQIQILLNDTARLVMGIKDRTSMRVKDLYRCLKWHTRESLINYHNYLLFWSINSNQRTCGYCMMKTRPM